MTLHCTTISRRAFLEAGAVATIGVTIVGDKAAAEVSSLKALVFDVIGTVVDWRTSVTREVETLAKRKGVTVDGAKFADAWRAGYGPSMNRVRTGELPWTKLDELHRMTLNKILVEFGGARGNVTEPLNLRRCVEGVEEVRAVRSNDWSLSDRPRATLFRVSA